MRKLDRILQEIPELESFRKQFEEYGTPSLARLTTRQLKMAVWKDVTNSSLSENIVYLVYPDETIKVDEVVWRAVEDHGVPTMMVNFTREDFNMSSQTDSVVYLNPDTDIIRGEVEYQIRLELERLHEIADGVKE